MRSRRNKKFLKFAGVFALLTSLAACGGGSSSSGGMSPTNPVPTVASVSPSSIAVGSPSAIVGVTGTNFISTSVVDVNGTPVTTTFVSSTLLNITVPSADLAQPATLQVSVANPSPGGGASGSENLVVTSIGTLVIMAAPTNGGPGNGPWQVSVAAVNSNGIAIPGLGVSLSASSGTLSQDEGITDSTGTLTLSVTPSASNTGEAVVVSATTGSQTAAVNIAFVPSVFSPSDSKFRERKKLSNSSSSSNVASTTPFVIGTAAAVGTTNPFLNPNICFSNVGLSTAPSADCETAYSQDGVQKTLINFANTVCDNESALVGDISCAGTAAIILACAASETGVGAVICDGTIDFLDDLAQQCLGYLVDLYAQYVTRTPLAGDLIDVIEFQPESAGVQDYVGLVCDAVSALEIGTGTGSTGVQVSITPKGATAVLGDSVDFSALVTNNSNANVTWSVNAVGGGSGPFGLISTTGVYTAPMILPVFGYVTITATSAADSTATASAVVDIVAKVPGEITTTAGNGTAGYLGDDGPAVSAELSQPSGIAFDGGGNMFVADSNNNVIRRVDASTGEITTIAGTGIAGYSGDGGQATGAQLNRPTHVVFDQTVNLYITDANNQRVRKVDALTGIITTLAGTGVAGYSGDGGPATSAELNFPDGVGLDGDGNLYIGDALNNRIRKVTAATGVITTVAGNGVAGYSGDGGQATNAELNFPSRPALDAAGNLYIADYQNNRIRRVDTSTGIIATVVGNGVGGFSGDGGLATIAELNGPISVTVDALGNLYIGDINNARIRVVNTTTNEETVLGTTIQPGNIVTVAGDGIVGYAGDNGAATDAEINFPTGLLVDTQGNLYFADANNNVVRRISGN
jgi:sugar lactone lactonase YvrE